MQEGVSVRETAFIATAMGRAAHSSAGVPSFSFLRSPQPSQPLPWNATDYLSKQIISRN